MEASTSPPFRPATTFLQTAAVEFYVVRKEFALAAGETKTFDIVLTFLHR